MTLAYWTPQDALVGRCDVEDVGRAREGHVTPVVVMDAVCLDNSPEAMVRVGVDTLMRIAQQQRDIPSALKAATALLDRALGKVMPPPQPQPAAGSLPFDPKDWPDWMTARRLAYQEAAAQGVDPMLEAPTRQ